MQTRYAIRAVVNPKWDCKILANIQSGTTDKVTAETIFQTCDETNANGMRFSKAILTKAIEKIDDEIKERHFLGELDHPDDIQNINRIATVSLQAASHVITELTIDGKHVIGKFETLSTHNGHQLAGMLRDNIKLGVSIRAVTNQQVTYSSTSTDDITDFDIISYDAVHNPAYKDAYVQSLIASIVELPNGQFSVKPLDAVSVAAKNDSGLITLTASQFMEWNKVLTNIIIENVHKLNKQ